MPGRVHDARVFRNSPLYNRLIGNPPPHLLPPAQHLLGDAAYPLLPNLLKPFRDNGHLNEIQLRFNQILSAQRSVIERAFALLKGKWRRLKYIDMSLSEEIPNVILAACILHNFVLNREMVDSDDEDEEEFNNVNIEANDRDNDFEDADNAHNDVPPLPRTASISAAESGFRIDCRERHPFRLPRAAFDSGTEAVSHRRTLEAAEGQKINFVLCKID
ncbi:hypothetical protein NQ317_014113 [Molorchus minor]|uniref:DDE Tnp4 domain-containing protein n=1 Tax=Molorchus minor TaxID=1323400 RepID=A0ABQ9JLK6_9CUCU|nr:hypothetical protein NQ317_014113 [Molorchus minor]